MKNIAGGLDLNLFNADDEDNTDFFPDMDMLSPDDMMLDSEPVTREQVTDAAKMVGEMALDVTPVVGDIKAATELPEDMRMARALIEQGYDEGDIIDMGLGGALGALSLAGFIPAGGAVADVLKKGVKETAKSRTSEQTKEMLEKQARISERAEILAKDRGILTKDVGTQFRGRNVPQGQLHRAKFSGEPKQKPTPKIFHGASSMRSSRSSEGERYTNLMSRFKHAYIKDPLLDMFDSPKIGEGNLMAGDGPLSADDVIKKQDGRIAVPVGSPDGEVAPATVQFRKNEDGNLDVYFFDPETGVSTDSPMGTVYKNMDNRFTYNKIKSTLEDISLDLSAPAGDVGGTRIDAIREGGFESYDDFRGERGLSGKSRGEHNELKQKMLSTSRDPLVAMKPGFGAGDTGNIVYADLPPELTRDMSAEEYVKAANLMAGEERVIPELAKGQIGYRLPKSIHLEAEEAIANPELLDAKVLADNPKLQDKVQRGQDMVNDILKKKNTIYTDVQYPNSAKGARQVYDRTKEVLNKLQSLGQFTEQYGARGTYDDLLETLLDTNKSNDFVDAIQLLPNDLPDGQRKKIATSMRSILNRIGQRSISGASFKAQEVLSGVSDKDLNDALFSTKRVGARKKRELDKAGLGIFMDGELDLEKLGYKDLKRLLFLGTQKMNRGGLASRK